MRDSRRSEPNGSSLYHAFLETASRDPGGFAWLECDVELLSQGTVRAWKWSELVDRVHQVAAWLTDADIAPGDRIVNLERNSVDWAVLDLACSAVGAIHAPLDPRSPDAILQSCAMQLDPKIIFANDESHFPGSLKLMQLRGTSLRPSLGLLQRWEQDVSTDNVACILFTSGTTQGPRGAMLTHGNLVHNARAKLDAMPQNSDDVRLNFLPFAHAYARTCELSAWILSGGTMACAHGLEQTFRLAATLQPTLVNGVPAFYDALYQRLNPDGLGSSQSVAGILGSRIRRLACGGAPIANALRQDLADLGMPIYQGYGLTEASPVVCSNRAATAESPAEMQGVGPPVDGVSLHIDSEDRIWVQGTGVMKGYWKSPDATAAKIQNGWLDTGDIAATNVPNRDSPNPGSKKPLVIAGRVDDLQVLKSGYKFLPQPIEQRIAQLPEIERCALFGNGRRSPILLVRLRDPSSKTNPETLLARVREALDGIPEYAKPKKVWMDPQPWELANGRLHWKGAVDRRALERLLVNMH